MDRHLDIKIHPQTSDNAGNYEIEYQRMNYWIKHIEHFLRANSGATQFSDQSTKSPIRGSLDQYQLYQEVHVKIEKLLHRLADFKRCSADQPLQSSTPTSHLRSCSSVTRLVGLEKRAQQCYIRSVEKQLELAAQSTTSDETRPEDDEELTSNFYEPLRKCRRLSEDDTIHKVPPFICSSTQHKQVFVSDILPAKHKAVLLEKTMIRLNQHPNLPPSSSPNNYIRTCCEMGPSAVDELSLLDDQHIFSSTLDKRQREGHQSLAVIGATASIGQAIVSGPLDEIDDIKEDFLSLTNFPCQSVGVQAGSSSLDDLNTRKLATSMEALIAGVAPRVPLCSGRRRKGSAFAKARSVPRSFGVTSKYNKKGYAGRVKLGNRGQISYRSRSTEHNVGEFDLHDWDDYQPSLYSSEGDSEDETAVRRTIFFDDDYSTSLPIVEPLFLPGIVASCVDSHCNNYSNGEYPSTARVSPSNDFNITNSTGDLPALEVAEAVATNHSLCQQRRSSAVGFEKNPEGLIGSLRTQILHILECRRRTDHGQNWLNYLDDVLSAFRLQKTEYYSSHFVAGFESEFKNLTTAVQNMSLDVAQMLQDTNRKPGHCDSCTDPSEVISGFNTLLGQMEEAIQLWKDRCKRIQNNPVNSTPTTEETSFGSAECLPDLVRRDKQQEFNSKSTLSWATMRKPSKVTAQSSCNGTGTANGDIWRLKLFRLQSEATDTLVSRSDKNLPRRTELVETKLEKSLDDHRGTVVPTAKECARHRYRQEPRERDRNSEIARLFLISVICLGSIFFGMYCTQPTCCSFTSRKPWSLLDVLIVEDSVGATMPF